MEQYGSSCPWYAGRLVVLVPQQRPHVVVERGVTSMSGMKNHATDPCRPTLQILLRTIPTRVLRSVAGFFQV